MCNIHAHTQRNMCGVIQTLDVYLVDRRWMDGWMKINKVNIFPNMFCLLNFEYSKF